MITTCWKATAISSSPSSLHTHTQIKDMLSTNDFHLLFFCLWACHSSFSSCERNDGSAYVLISELAERIALLRERALGLEKS